MRSVTDVCWTCQKNNNQTEKSANLPEAEKAEAVRAHKRHLDLSSGERKYYQDYDRQSKDLLEPCIKDFDFWVERDPVHITGRYIILTISSELVPYLPIKPFFTDLNIC